MTRRLIALAAPAYVVLCIVAGGSTQGIWANLVLQLLGVALIVAAAFAPATATRRVPAALAMIALAALAWASLQLIPLPPSLWAALPGREPLVGSFALLGQPLPASPVSMTPYDSIATLFAAIPALAVLIAACRLFDDERMFAFIVVGMAIISVLLGAVQVADGSSSWAYLYPIHSSSAVGFFANTNHLATILLIAIPVLAALVAGGSKRGGAIRYAIAALALVLILAGIALTRSLAALALAPAVLVASALLLPGSGRGRTGVIATAGALLVVATAAIALNPASNPLFGSEANMSVTSRKEIWATTVQAIGATSPAGSGLGSFGAVYQLYEDPQTVGAEYVNHAHNDYLEAALELGVPGILLILAFVGWWAATAARVWTSPGSTPLARAATIATAAVLAQSIVDFPLRTAAVSALFAALLVWMIRPARAPTLVKGPGSRARHRKIG